MNMSYIIAVTLAELRGMEEPREDLIYFVTDPGQEGHFIYDPADNTSPDNTGTIVASAPEPALSDCMTEALTPHGLVQ